MFRRAFSVFAIPLLCLLSTAANAGNFSVTNLTLGDFDAIVKEFSANSVFTTVSPASSLGNWGFELGVVAGLTKTPNLDGLVSRADPTQTGKFKNFPHAAIVGVVSLPWYALTLELNAFPHLTASNITYQEYGGAVKWSFSDVFLPEWPVTFATRAFYQQSKLNFTETVSGVPVAVNFTDSIYGANLVMSHKFLFLEPYAAFGFAHAKGTMSLVGPTIFNFATVNNTTSASHTSANFIGGVNFQLAFFVLGAEYQHIFDTDNYTGKLSFRF